MTNELRTAARITAQSLRIDALEDELASERARADQLAASLHEHRRRLARLERAYLLRTQIINRLRSRVQDIRRSRDLWKHRALRGRS